GDERQGDAVVAPALTGRCRPVVEHVTLVPAAADAVILGSRQDQPVVSFRAPAPVDRLVEARPAGAAVELGVRTEEREIARRAHERASTLFLVERAREGRFRPRLEQNRVRLWR